MIHLHASQTDIVHDSQKDSVHPQAAAAVVRAHAAGIRRQKLELLLPQAGVTSAQGSWPGGIRQQAQVAIPSLIEPLLRRLKQEDVFQVLHCLHHQSRFFIILLAIFIKYFHHV